MNRSFGVDITREGEHVVARLEGELDVTNRQLATKLLAELFGAESVELDLRGLRFMDTTGVNLVARVLTHHRAKGRTVTIKATGLPARLLTVTGLDKIATVEVD